MSHVNNAVSSEIFEIFNTYIEWLTKGLIETKQKYPPFLKENELTELMKIAATLTAAHIEVLKK